MCPAARHVSGNSPSSGTATVIRDMRSGRRMGCVTGRQGEAGNIQIGLASEGFTQSVLVISGWSFLNGMGACLGPGLPRPAMSGSHAGRNAAWRPSVDAAELAGSTEHARPVQGAARGPVDAPIGFMSNWVRAQRLRREALRGGPCRHPCKRTLAFRKCPGPARRCPVSRYTDGQARGSGQHACIRCSAISVPWIPDAVSPPP